MFPVQSWEHKALCHGPVIYHGNLGNTRSREHRASGTLTRDVKKTILLRVVLQFYTTYLEFTWHYELRSVHTDEGVHATEEEDGQDDGKVTDQLPHLATRKQDKMSTI